MLCEEMETEASKIDIIPQMDIPQAQFSTSIAGLGLRMQLDGLGKAESNDLTPVTRPPGPGQSSSCNVRPYVVCMLNVEY